MARRAIAQVLVLPLPVIEVEPGADAGLCLGDAGIGVEVDLLVFETAPQPLDKEKAGWSKEQILNTYLECLAAVNGHLPEMPANVTTAPFGRRGKPA